MTPRQKAITAARVQDPMLAERQAHFIRRIWGSDRELSKESPRAQWVRLQSGKYIVCDRSRRLQARIDAIAAEKLKASLSP